MNRHLKRKHRLSDKPEQKDPRFILSDKPKVKAKPVKKEQRFIADDTTKCRKSVNKNIKIIDAGILVPDGRVQRHWQENPFKINKFAPKSAIPTGKFKDSNIFIEYFGLRSVEFGNWMSEEDRHQFMYAAADCLFQLADFFNCTHKEIGLDGKLSIALGARGQGGLANAHYERSPWSIINITKPHVASGSFAHEFAHAVDNLISYHIENKYGDFVTGGRMTSKQIDEEILAENSFRGIAENIFNILYWDNGEKTNFQKALNQKNLDYWERRNEVFARSFETYFYSKNGNHGNVMLAGMNTGEMYPDKILIGKISPLMFKFMSTAIKSINENRSVHQAKSPAVKKEIPKIKVTEIPKVKEEKPDYPKSIIVYGDALTIATESENIPGRYAVTELSNLIASHYYTNFKKNPKYPAGCQERDYAGSEKEQGLILQYSKNFKPNFLITDDPTAENGSPVITSKFIVLGGNKRTMILQRVQEIYPDKFNEYQNYLLKKIRNFGIEPGQIEHFKNPVLVRVTDVNMTECSKYSRLLNTSKKADVNAGNRAVALAKEIPESSLNALGEVLSESESESFLEMLSTPLVCRKLIQILKAAKIINDQNFDNWVENETFTPVAKITLQEMMLNLLFPDYRQLSEAPIYLNNILKCYPAFLRMKRIKGKWSFIPLFQDAIRTAIQAKRNKLKKSDFKSQTTIGSEKLTEEVEICWDILDLRIKAFRIIIYKLAQIAETRSQESGNDFMFEMQSVEPITVLRDAIRDGKEIESGQKKADLSDKSMRMEKYLRKESIYHKMGRKGK